MDCHKANKLLVHFLEGDLTGRYKEKVEAHLKICAHCQKERELFFQSWQILDNYTTPKLRDDFTPSLMKKIHTEQIKNEKVSRRLPRFSLQNLALVSVLLTVLVTTFCLLLKKPIQENIAVRIMPLPIKEKLVSPLNHQTLSGDEQAVGYGDAQQLVNNEKPSTPVAGVSLEVAPSQPQKVVTPEKGVTPLRDEEVVKNLDILENVDFLKNIRLLNDLEVVENLKEPIP